MLRVYPKSLTELLTEIVGIMKYKPKKKKEIKAPTDWRKKLEMRGKSRYLLTKGILKKQNCQLCYHPQTKMVHVNYEDPLNVIWLCEKHYLNFRKEKRIRNTKGIS